MADRESGVGGDNVVGVDGLCNFRVLWLTLYCIYSPVIMKVIVNMRVSRAAVLQAINSSDNPGYHAHIARVA